MQHCRISLDLLNPGGDLVTLVESEGGGIHEADMGQAFKYEVNPIELHTKEITSGLQIFPPF